MDNKVVGILGGGQLGRMVVEAANRLNVKTVVLDAANSPAKQINASDEHIDGSFSDYKSIFELARKCDVLTVEIEHVDADALQEVQDKLGVQIYPLPHTIKLIQDKYRQKEHLSEHGIGVAASVSVESNQVSELEKVGKRLGYPFVLKAKTMAYDGRGNFVVRTSDELKKALEFLTDRPLYAEKWCHFVKELAVMVVRTAEGEVFAYPTVETVHKENICHLVYSPARINDSLRVKSSILAKNAVKSFPGCGIFGVELFLLPDNELLVNEIAPRPHNSGHYTIDACVTSQFEAHVRAVVGLPLPRGFSHLATNNTNAIMLNVLGEQIEGEELQTCQRALQTSNASVYLYGKSSRPKRKLGHINMVSSSMRDCESKLAYIMDQTPQVYEEASQETKPLVGIIMGSDSDLPIMSVGANILKRFGVPFEVTIVSAHRTPHRMVEYALEAAKRGLRCIIAGAGGAAHLPGMVAAMTPLPVIGVPVKGSSLDGVDSLHSIVQMPKGIPVATVAINNSTNAALLATRILAASDNRWYREMNQYMENMESEVISKVDKLSTLGYENYK